MKRFLITAVIAVSMLGLMTACSGKSDDASSESSTSSVSSEESEVSVAEEKITVAAPNADSFKYQLDGTYLFISFDSVENADCYEWDYEGNVITLDANSGKFTNVKNGATYTSKFRSVNNSGSEPVYSDWTEVTYTVPTINWDKLSLGACIYATEATLEEQAEARGYTVEKTTGTDTVTVRISKKDPNNTGFGKAIDRMLTGAVNGATNDYSELEDSLNKFIDSAEESGSFIEAAKSTVSGVLQNVKNGAISGAMDALDENYIVYTFTYSDVNAGADLCIRTEMKEGNSSDVQSMKKANTDKLGRYLFTAGCDGQDYCVDISSITEGGVEKYCFTYTKS